MLRETAHSNVHGDHQVVMDLSHLDQTHYDLVYSWIEIWLHRNCKSGWHIVTKNTTAQLSEPHFFIRVDFDDPREALYFKLSPEFVSNGPGAGRKLRDWLASQEFLLKKLH